MRTRAERIHYRMTKTNRKKVLAEAKENVLIKAFWEDEDGRVRDISWPYRTKLKKQASRKVRRYRRRLCAKGNTYKKLFDIKWNLV